MKRHESTDDFKTRIASILRDPNEPKRIEGAKRAHPCVVRPSGRPSPTKPEPEIPPCKVCGGILSHKDDCKYQGRRVHV